MESSTMAAEAAATKGAHAGFEGFGAAAMLPPELLLLLLLLLLPLLLLLLEPGILLEITKLGFGEAGLEDVKAA